MIVKNSYATIEDSEIARLSPSASSVGYIKFRVDYLDYKDFEGDTLTASLDIRKADVESTFTTANNLYAFVGVNIPSRLGNGLNQSYDRYGSRLFNFTEEEDGELTT